MSEQTQQLNAEEQERWVREHFQKANQYLAERGLLSERILTKESRYLIPSIALWKFKLNSGKSVWVINGAVSTDHVAADVAKTARDAMRHFSLNWQLKAEQILRAERKPNETEEKMAQLLIRNAEAVYEVTQREELWPSD